MIFEPPSGKKVGLKMRLLTFIFIFGEYSKRVILKLYGGYSQ